MWRRFLLVVAFFWGVPTLPAQPVQAVGYVNMSILPGYNFIANPLSLDDNRISTIFHSPLPDGFAVLLFNGTGFERAVFNAATGQFEPAELADVILAPGTGFVVHNPAAQFTITLVGTILQGELSKPMPAGISLQASMTVRQGTLESMEFPIRPGEQVYLFDERTQRFTVYIFDDLEMRWLPSVPRLEVGESFFVRLLEPRVWTQTFYATQIQSGPQESRGPAN